MLQKEIAIQYYKLNDILEFLKILYSISSNSSISHNYHKPRITVNKVKKNAKIFQTIID